MVIAEYKYVAQDQKSGMTLEELTDTLTDFSTADRKRYKLKATVGVRGQVKTLTFIETTKPQ